MPSPHAVLLPPYDEYTVAYQDRSAALDPKRAAGLHAARAAAARYVRFLARPARIS